MLNEAQMSELRTFVILQLKQDIAEFADMTEQIDHLSSALKDLSNDMEALDKVLFGDGDETDIAAAWERYQASREKDADPTGQHRRRGASSRREGERRSPTPPARHGPDGC